jgi:hypothetical protein
MRRSAASSRGRCRNARPATTTRTWSRVIARRTSASWRYRASKRRTAVSMTSPGMTRCASTATRGSSETMRDPGAVPESARSAAQTRPAGIGPAFRSSRRVSWTYAAPSTSARSPNSNTREPAARTSDTATGTASSTDSNTMWLSCNGRCHSKNRAPRTAATQNINRPVRFQIVAARPPATSHVSGCRASKNERSC